MKSIVNQDSNLAMKGFVGYMQKYADTMPVSSLKWFMETEFPNRKSASFHMPRHMQHISAHSLCAAFLNLLSFHHIVGR